MWEQFRSNYKGYIERKRVGYFLAYFSFFLLFWKESAMIESNFQRAVKKEIKERFPDCIIFKTDATQIQGIPDLMILYEDKWAALEVKKDANASHRPNQDYYVERANEMSFARFIFPENKQEVLDELQQAFGVTGQPRTAKSK